MAFPCSAPEKLPPSSPFATERIKANMKKIIPVSATWMWMLFAVFLFASVSIGFGKPQKKSPAADPEKPDALLAAAMENMTKGVWSVNGTVTVKKTIKLHGLLSGEDFDLSMDPGVKPDTPMREIAIREKAWICSDGETWHAGGADDRLLYNWAHVPIMADRHLPPFEKVGTEQHDGQSWLHVRLKVPEKKINPKELPQYWLVLDSQGQAQYIGHTEMPMFSQVKKEVLYCSFDYAPAKENISPPPAELITNPAAKAPADAPVDDKVRSFNEIEQHKFDLAGKVVRIEVSPKLLQSEQIADDTYRVMLEDTATPLAFFGLVEFNGEALVKLGLLKKTTSGGHNWTELEKMGLLGKTDGPPITFYVRVIPIGEKPAARKIALGSKFSRASDGSITYSW